MKLPEELKNLEESHRPSPFFWLFPDVDKMPGKVGWSTDVRWNLCKRWLEVLRQENLEHWLFGVHTDFYLLSFFLRLFCSFLFALLQSFCWAIERWRDSSIGQHSQRREGRVHGIWSKSVMRVSDQKPGERCNSLTSHVTILGGTSKWRVRYSPHLLQQTGIPQNWQSMTPCGGCWWRRDWDIGQTLVCIARRGSGSLVSPESGQAILGLRPIESKCCIARHRGFQKIVHRRSRFWRIQFVHAIGS